MLKGYCNTSHTAFSGMNSLEVRSGLEERRSGLARYGGTVDWDRGRVRLYVKVYTGDSDAAMLLRSQVGEVVEAARSLFGIVASDASDAAEAAEKALSNGVSPPVAVCHSTLYTGGSMDPWSVAVVAPYVDGVSFYSLARRAGGKLSIADVRRLYCSFLEAATKIESAEVIHGDLNPGNIFYVESGGGYRAVIVDFDGAVRKSSVRKRGARPLFVFDLDQGNVALTPGADLLDASNILYLDYAESVYVGLEFLLRSEGREVVERASFAGPLDEGHELSRLLGRSYVRHLNRVIEGDFNGLGGMPIARLKRDLEGEGVCP